MCNIYTWENSCERGNVSIVSHRRAASPELSGTWDGNSEWTVWLTEDPLQWWSDSWFSCLCCTNNGSWCFVSAGFPYSTSKATLLHSTTRQLPVCQQVQQRKGKLLQRRQRPATWRSWTSSLAVTAFCVPQVTILGSAGTGLTSSGCIWDTAMTSCAGKWRYRGT
jgi:hypothetical protein